MAITAHAAQAEGAMGHVRRARSPRVGCPGRRSCQWQADRRGAEAATDPKPVMRSLPVGHAGVY
jgi:hypothetical protein